MWPSCAPIKLIHMLSAMQDQSLTVIFNQAVKTRFWLVDIFNALQMWNFKENSMLKKISVWQNPQVKATRPKDI